VSCKVTTGTRSTPARNASVISQKDPAPPPEHRDGEQHDECNERGQEGGLRPMVAGWQAEGLVVNVRCRDADREHAHQDDKEEGEHQRLGPVDHRAPQG
jgi:hypothetical protein